MSGRGGKGGWRVGGREEGGNEGRKKRDEEDEQKGWKEREAEGWTGMKESVNESMKGGKKGRNGGNIKELLRVRERHLSKLLCEKAKRKWKGKAFTQNQVRLTGWNDLFTLLL